MKATKETNRLFKTRTYSVYRHMEKRSYEVVQKAMQVSLDFTLEEFRAMVELKLGFGLCDYCRQKITVKTFSLDHKVPISRGGSFGKENVQIICASCNKSKGGMTHNEYLALLKSLDTLEEGLRNFTLKAKILTALRVSNSFRIGANRRRMR